MTTVRLQDKQWAKVRDFLRGDPNAYIGKDEEECRRFVEGVLWITRSGASWRLLPSEYGRWNTIYKRFARWCDQVYGKECSSTLPTTRIWNRDD